MREFSQDTKINFIDKNDVLVGYDNFSGCCEKFGYYYASDISDLAKLRDTLMETIRNQKGHYTSFLGFSDAPVDLEPYYFDPHFYIHSPSYYMGDSFDLAIFKLEASQNQDSKNENSKTEDSKNENSKTEDSKKQNPLYLVLFNCQSGYYSHGFEFSNKGTILEQGSL